MRVPNESGNRLATSSQTLHNLSADNQPSAEHHYTVSEIAALWGVSADLVRRLFYHEVGVLRISRSRYSSKRRYTTLRIPRSVLDAVHRRLTLWYILIIEYYTASDLSPPSQKVPSPPKRTALVAVRMSHLVRRLDKGFACSQGDGNC
jgi:AraC-like DNA-binding protein